MGFLNLFKRNKNISNDNGVNKIYFENGKGEQIKLNFTKKDSKYHGLYTEYFENGNKKCEIEYFNGKIHGKLLRYNSEGILIREVTTKDDKRKSIQKDYYSNGQIKLEIDEIKGEYKYFTKEGFQKFLVYFDYKESRISHVSRSIYPPKYNNSVWGNYRTGYSTPTAKWTYFNEDGSVNYEIDFCLNDGIYEYGFAYLHTYNQNKLISTKSIEILNFNVLGLIIFSNSLYYQNEYDKEYELMCESNKSFKKVSDYPPHLIRYTYTNFELDKQKLKKFIKSENPLIYAFGYESCMRKLMYQYMLKTNTLGKFKKSESKKTDEEFPKIVRECWNYKKNNIIIEQKKKYSTLIEHYNFPSGYKCDQDYILTFEGDLFGSGVKTEIKTKKPKPKPKAQVVISKEEAKKELVSLKEYLDLGIITQEEFDKKAVGFKKILLGD